MAHDFPDRPVRVLLVADTHLGFDMPRRPRVERPRRGQDFFDNFHLALEPARNGEVDLVVHGGDLLFRSRVPQGLSRLAFEPLREVAELGVPVVVVPGNHERSRLDLPLGGDHPLLHVVHDPRTVAIDVRGATVAVSGFPFVRKARREFRRLVAASRWSDVEADIRLLAIHQAVEGAQVGPSGFTFRRGDDVVRAADLPAGFAAVLAGHIHRHQVLTRDLDGVPLASPVLYPGSVERTSSAERFEAKGYLVLELQPSGDGGDLIRWEFRPLPAREMVELEVEVGGKDARELTAAVRTAVAGLPENAVVGIRLNGEVDERARPALRAEAVRQMTPPSMHLTVRWPPKERRKM